jgi:hypothetical protein
MFPTSLTFYSNDEGDNWVINDRSSSGQPNLWEDSPYYYISAQVDGLRGADISYETHPIPNYIGEYSGDVIRRGKGIAISGDIRALNLSYLEAGADYLQEMFAETLKRKLVWTRWADGVTVYLKCRVSQDLVVVENIDSDYYKYTYTVGLRADDPRTRNFSGDAIYPTFQE